MSRNYILRTKIFRPLQPPEVYTRQALESAFPGGEWVEESPEEGGRLERGLPRAVDMGASGRPITPDEGKPETPTGVAWSHPRPGITDDLGGPLSKRPSTSLTIIGDTKDLELVTEYVMTHEPEQVILGRLPSGRGAESKIAAVLKEAGASVLEIEHDPELFGKADVNVEQVLSRDITSPVLLVGKGVRVKQARSWLARAEWNREVIEL